MILQPDALDYEAFLLALSQHPYKVDVKERVLEVVAPKWNMQVRYPFNINLSEGLSVVEEEVLFAIVLIQSENAAIGIVEEGVLVENKVFKTYMVRKKQGKSQLKHLNAKGKSKAGSRLRLSNTVNFFEDINQSLVYYFDDYAVGSILISCPIALSSHFYTSKTPPPFNKKDERLQKINFHIHSPNNESLRSVAQHYASFDITFEGILPMEIQLFLE